MKKGLVILMLVMFLSLVVASLWDSVPAIKNSVHAVLNPSFGYLINLNLHFGFIVVILFVTFLTTLIQKYATDQAALKTLKDEQKAMQEEMKQYQNNPSKMLEMQKESMKFAMPMIKLSMRPIVYTAVPLILFFRWFADFFTLAGDPKFFGVITWFWFYLLGSLIFSAILRKIFKVV